MKITHVIDYHYEHLGYEVSYLTQAQKALGHDVSIVASDQYIAPDGTRSERTGFYEHKGIPTHRLRSFVVLGARRWLVGLRKILRELQPEVVHQHGTVDITGVRVAAYQKHMGYALVCDCHAAYFNSRADGVLRQSVYSLFRHTGGRLIKARAGALTAIGENEQVFLCQALKLPAAQVPIVRLGVDTGRFQFNPGERARLRPEWGFPDDTIVLIHVGSVRPSKRLDLLLGVVQALRQSQLKVSAVIVAIGAPEAISDLRGNVERLGLTEHLRIVNFVRPAELPAYYSAADIAVWPGDISIAALEAISVGLPLVGIDDPYVRHITKNGNGLTFPRGSEAGLLERCLTLTRDPELRHKLGRLARQFAVDELAWDRLAGKYLAIYQACLPLGNTPRTAGNLEAPGNHPARP